VLQIVQSLKTGKLNVQSLPEPAAAPGEVLIANQSSVISAGTEKTAIELARKSLVGKALERPDHVRRVLEKLRNEGLLSTITQVRSKLEESFGLGYSSAGTVLAVGPGVRGMRPGDRVASNGPHAGVVAVPQNLCALVPENVPSEQAAYAVLAAIALNAVRLARVGLGDTVYVIGLGLVGQLAVALAKVNGCRVFGTDLDPLKCELALKMGAEAARIDLGAADVLERSRGIGADAVLIAASTPSDSPVELAAEAVRQKGRVVALGAVGLHLPRRPFYFKEAEFVVSCSYGPGRYDPEYEDRGRDYPVGHVRWTEQRNLQAVLDLLASNRLDFSPLTSHRFKIDEAEKAYSMIEEGRERYLGIVLEYPGPAKSAPVRRIERRPNAGGAAAGIAVGVLGAGNFAKNVIIPILKRDGRLRPRILCAGSGLSAGQIADKFDFEIAATDEAEVFADPATQVVFVVTRHDLHASQVLKALKAGKHVFTEKPLALTAEEVFSIDQAISGSSAILMVGFNRRFSPAAQSVRKAFQDIPSPLTVSIRMNAGSIAPDHWTQSEEEGGGRIIGEACHAIDLATFLTGSVPIRVHVESIGGPSAPKISEDQCFITLRHANGSISSIGYLAGGDRSGGKERVEVLGGGKMAIIDDFSQVTVASKGKVKTDKRWAQDKGHRAELEAFVTALVKGGASPISWEEIRSVSLASILAVRSLREGIPFDLP
jgi:predicted dehydrogenase/threonine dehydrogenase-like Zn-dependent dehydrogenase